MHTARQIVSFKRFTRTLRISNGDVAQYTADLHAFATRLGSISGRARKLFVQIVELAYHGRGQQRKTDVAYLPELYECTGLGVEEMYPLLEELKAAGFVAIEDRYPFEDIMILRAPSGWNVVSALTEFAAAQKISLRDLLVDVRFDLLQ